MNLANTLPLQAFQNMTPGVILSAHLLDEPLVLPLMADTKTIHPEWAGKLSAQIFQIEEQGRRLYFKSMGAILTRQTSIAKGVRVWGMCE